MEKVIDFNMEATINYPDCSDRAVEHLSIKELANSLIGEDILSDLVNGILLLTDEKKIVYSNLYSRRILKQLDKSVDGSSQIPLEIWHICQYLIDIRSLFPGQFWLTQFDIFVENLAILHIHARWLTADTLDRSYLLLLIEDRKNILNKIISQEADHYGLTPREREVWLLHRRGRTYKQISFELKITPNTDKKHMKSIHSKRKKSIFFLDTADY